MFERWWWIVNTNRSNETILIGLDILESTALMCCGLDLLVEIPILTNGHESWTLTEWTPSKNSTRTPP